MECLLIVDDDKELCELLAELLNEEDFDVEAVSKSKQGLERALSGEHSLIVLDVMMPGMNGFEVLRRLHSRGTTVAAAPERIAVGDMEVDTGTRHVKRAGESIPSEHVTSAEVSGGRSGRVL